MHLIREKANLAPCRDAVGTCQCFRLGLSCQLDLLQQRQLSVPSSAGQAHQSTLQSNCPSLTTSLPFRGPGRGTEIACSQLEGMTASLESRLALGAAAFRRSGTGSGKTSAGGLCRGHFEALWQPRPSVGGTEGGLSAERAPSLQRVFVDSVVRDTVVGAARTAARATDGTPDLRSLEQGRTKKNADQSVRRFAQGAERTRLVKTARLRDQGGHEAEQTEQRRRCCVVTREAQSAAARPGPSSRGAREPRGTSTQEGRRPAPVLVSEKLFQKRHRIDG